MTVMFRVFAEARASDSKKGRERDKGRMDVRRILIWKRRRRVVVHTCVELRIRRIMCSLE
jgi:hypothetical protein